MFTNAALKAAAAAGNATTGNAAPATSKASKSAKTSSTQSAAYVDSSALADIKMSIQDRLKSKFNLHNSYKDSKQQQSHSVAGTSQKSEDEDPYAFPDGDPEPVNNQNNPAVTSQSINDTVSAIVANCLNNHHLNNSGASGHVMTTASVNSTSSVIYSSSGSVASNSDTTSATVQNTPIAKLYPELAEKLHLPALSDRKVSPVASSGSLSPGSASKTPPRNTKSARTINKLQTKIAQNRIKDKLKRSQSVSSSSNQSSPDRKTNPVSPVITMTASLTNWPTVSSIPSISAMAAISTSSTTNTTSSLASSSLQSLISQLPPLDQPLWSVQQQLQHGIQPENVTGQGTSSVTPASNVPLLSIAPAYNNAMVTASLTHTTPLTTAMTNTMTTASPNMTALQQLTHLATQHTPSLTTASSLGSVGGYSPLLAVETATTTSSYNASAHPPPPPYPGSPPRILEPSNPIPQPPKPKPPRKAKKEPKKDTKKLTKAAPQPKNEPSPSTSSQPIVSCASSSSSKTPLSLPKTNSSCCVKVQKTKGILTEKEARQKLKRHSAVRVYAYYANLTTNRSHLLPMGVDSSDSEEEDLARYQHHWLSSSSEEEDANELDEEEETGTDHSSMMRITKLSLLHAKKRRQYMQMRRVNQVNVSCRHYQQRALQALVDAARKSESAAERAVKYIHHKRKAEKDELRVEPSCKRPCLYRNDDSSKCENNAMPFTNQCHEHIMYNVDQQLFEYCTAKFSNNKQCCVPVIDVKHELPLCTEHGQKADNYQKSQEQGKPKKPRKKTKPSALTRPPKKGKKRKNQKKSKNPKPEDVTSQSDAMETENEGDGGSVGKGKLQVDTAPPASPSVPPAPVVHLVEDEDDEEAEEEEEEEEKQPRIADFSKSLEPPFSPSGIDNGLELPPLDMDEAAKFLDKHDLSDVLKEPFPDLFNTGNSNAAPTPPPRRLENRAAVAEPPLAATPPFLTSSREESDMIDQALADVAQGVAFPGDKEEDDDDELTKQIIANSLLHQSPPASDDDETNDQNLSKLASSLTPHDLKSISQVLTSAFQDPNQTIGGLLEYDGSATVPMTTTTNSASMLMGYDNSVVSSVGLTGGFQTVSSVQNVSGLGYQSGQSVTSAPSSDMLLGYNAGSGLNHSGLATTVTPDLSTVSVSATTNGGSLSSIGIEDYINQAGLQLIGSNNQHALYNGHVMEAIPNPGPNTSTTIQASAISLQGSQQANPIQAMQPTSSFQGSTIQAPLSQGITFSAPGQQQISIQAPLIQQHLHGIQIQAPLQPGVTTIQTPQQLNVNNIQAPSIQQQNVTNIQAPSIQQQSITNIQAPSIQQQSVTNIQAPGIQQQSVTNIQAPSIQQQSVTNIQAQQQIVASIQTPSLQQSVTNIQAPPNQQLQHAQQTVNSFQQQQPLSFLSTGNASLALNSSSNTLAALAQHRTSSSSSSSSSTSSISSLAAALASVQQPSAAASAPATTTTHIRHLLAAAAAKPPAVTATTSASSLSQLLGNSSNEASISQLAALFSSQQQGGRGAGGNSNITLAVALASQAPHLSHSLVTAAAASTPPPQPQSATQDSSASANAQISAIAAALANNHPVPPINPGGIVQSDSSGPANGLLKPPHTSSTHASYHLS